MISSRLRTAYLMAPVVVVTLYAAAVAGTSWQNVVRLGGLIVWFSRPVLLLWFGLGIAFILVQLILEAMNPRRRPLPAYLLELLRVGRKPSVQISFLVPPLVLIVLLSAYGIFKQVMIPATGYWAGPFIAALEYKLLFHHHAWEFTHAVLPLPATIFLDQVYQVWLVLVLGSALICSYLAGDPLHRCRFMLCFVGTWIISGTVLAYLIPASGPVYFGYFQALPDPFIALKAQLLADDQAVRAQGGFGLMALKGQHALLRLLQDRTIAPCAGISAMPSMHNAVSILLACAGLSIHRWLGAALTIFAALIFVASIHLGWHYALDGIVAGIISVTLWVSSSKIIARYERRGRARRQSRDGSGRRRADRYPAMVPLPITA